MKKLLTLVMLVFFGICLFADNQVEVVGWGIFTSSDNNKFLEDIGFKSGIGFSNLWLGNERIFLKGYFLPNQNSDLQFSLSIKKRWKLTAKFNQFLKWWDTSAGHEKTPAGFTVADWFPRTNTISPLSDLKKLHTTRRSLDLHLNYALSPLQKLAFGFRFLTKNGQLTPFFRGFTYVGDVPLSATAASLRNYDLQGKEANLKGNFVFKEWYLDFEANFQSWNNDYSSSLGTFNYSSQIALTEITDHFPLHLFYGYVSGGRTFKKAEIFGTFFYSRQKNKPTNSLTEAGTYFSGERSGLGSIIEEAKSLKLGFSWRPLSWLWLHLAGNRLNRSTDGDYQETRTDFPALWNSDSGRELNVSSFRSRARFIFRRFKLEIYARFRSRKFDKNFSTIISQSRFDRSLFQDLTRNQDEWQEGLKIYYRVLEASSLRVRLEAYQRDENTDLRDLTWDYYPGDKSGTGINGTYNFSLNKGQWQLFVLGNINKWKRDLAPPYFDPIYDPSQLIEKTSTNGQVQQHILGGSTSLGKFLLNLQFGFIQEELSLKEPFVGFNYQPVEYDLKGLLFSFSGVFNSPGWSLAGDIYFIRTRGTQEHNRIRASLDFSRKIKANQSLVIGYHFFDFNEKEFNLDDYQGHFLSFGWRYKF